MLVYYFNNNLKQWFTYIIDVHKSSWICKVPTNNNLFAFICRYITNNANHKRVYVWFYAKHSVMYIGSLIIMINIL